MLQHPREQGVSAILSYLYKAREGITVEVDYGGDSYEAQIVRMHGKFH